MGKWMEVHYQVHWEQIPNITMLKAVTVKTKNVAMSNAKHLLVQ